MSINVEFLNNRTGEITAGAFLVSITETVGDYQQIERGAVDHFAETNFFLFDFDSKGENGRMSVTGRAVLLKFDSLHSLENYLISVCLLKLFNDSPFPNTS